jgi:hypothetical protein
VPLYRTDINSLPLQRKSILKEYLKFQINYMRIVYQLLFEISNTLSGWGAFLFIVQGTGEARAPARGMPLPYARTDALSSMGGAFPLRVPSFLQKDDAHPSGWGAFYVFAEQT